MEAHDQAESEAAEQSDRLPEQPEQTFPPTPPGDLIPVGTDEANEQSERQQADAERDAARQPDSEPEPDAGSSRAKSAGKRGEKD